MRMPILIPVNRGTPESYYYNNINRLGAALADTHRRRLPHHLRAALRPT